jgi:hypothetical protein
VDQTIKEVRDQTIEFCRAGRAVKVDGRFYLCSGAPARNQ